MNAAAERQSNARPDNVPTNFSSVDDMLAEWRRIAGCALGRYRECDAMADDAVTLAWCQHNRIPALRRAGIHDMAIIWYAVKEIRSKYPHGRKVEGRRPGHKDALDYACSHGAYFVHLREYRLDRILRRARLHARCRQLLRCANGPDHLAVMERVLAGSSIRQALIGVGCSEERWYRDCDIAGRRLLALERETDHDGQAEEVWRLAGL